MGAGCNGTGLVKAGHSLRCDCAGRTAQGTRNPNPHRPFASGPSVVKAGQRIDIDTGGFQHVASAKRGQIDHEGAAHDLGP